MELSNLEIQNLVEEVSGANAVPVAEFIINTGENISEFLIAEKLEVGINFIRNILYKLQENNLVTFMRKKDKQIVIKDHQYEINADGTETDTERYGKGDVNGKN